MSCFRTFVSYFQCILGDLDIKVMLVLEWNYKHLQNPWNVTTTNLWSKMANVKAFCKNSQKERKRKECNLDFKIAMKKRGFDISRMRKSWFTQHISLIFHKLTQKCIKTCQKWSKSKRSFIFKNVPFKPFCPKNSLNFPLK